MQAGHFGQAPFDPVGLADDYKRQAEVHRMSRQSQHLFIAACSCVWYHFQPCLPASLSWLESTALFCGVCGGNNSGFDVGAGAQLQTRHAGSPGLCRAGLGHRQGPHRKCR
jgi:hypothetical protein